MSPSERKVAVIGTGPAGLMAAQTLAEAGLRVMLFDKKRGPGRKLLIAGSSGLNVSYDDSDANFHRHYAGPQDRFQRVFEISPPSRWIRLLDDLGVGTFLGTSRRYFVKGMKGSKLLRAWLLLLEKLGVEFRYGMECVDFESTTDSVVLRFADQSNIQFAGAIFCLGGASWEPNETPLRWPALFEKKHLSMKPFAASNVGMQVAWPEEFLKEAEGQPLKTIQLTTPRGCRQGDLVVTNYGLEGTPVYFVGQSGPAFLDLKPDLSVEKILEKMSAAAENLAPIRRAKKYLNLCPASLALLFHLAPAEIRADLRKLSQFMKRFPIELGEKQPLQEAISSSGGLSWDELDDNLMLKRFPGVFAAGEMLDWDAPTGGFLIQASVSQGEFAARGALTFLYK